MSTKDISDQYDRWARSSSVFGANTGCAGDRLALSSGRVDSARLELHQACEREAATNSIPYR